MASVLVVDDEPDIRYLNQLILERDGHRVMTAADGNEALAAVHAEVPDVIILDVLMPEVDGWSVLEQLKSHFDQEIASTRVLMMTALGTADDRIRGGIEGAVRYLVKPVSPEELCRVVREVMEGGPERQQRLAAQTDALAELSQRETGRTNDPRTPRPKLSRLENRRSREEAAAPPTSSPPVGLTDKQQELLRALADTPSVSDAAARLGVSRSNVYASLRRIARRLEIDSVPDLLRQLRAGAIDVGSP